MGKECSICKQKQKLFFSKVHLDQINGVSYCQNCYPKVFGNPECHPIPDSMRKGLSGVDYEFLSDNEYAFWDQLTKRKVRIHRFLHYPLWDRRTFTPGSFLGLDLYSGNPVWVNYAENDTASDGGPSYVKIHDLSTQEFSNMLSRLPQCISEKFADFSKENWQVFRDFKLYLDLSKVSYNLMHEDDDVVKIVRHSSDHGFVYCELSKDAYTAWRTGKDPVLCAVTIPSLSEKADFCLQSGVTPMLMKNWKQLVAYLEECCNCGYDVPAEQANMIRIQNNSRQLRTCCVPPDKIKQVLTHIEHMYPDNFEKRASYIAPVKVEVLK